MFLNGPSLYSNQNIDPFAYEDTWIAGGTAGNTEIDSGDERQIDFPETMYGNAYFTRTIDNYVCPETGLYQLSFISNYRPEAEPTGLDVIQALIYISLEKPLATTLTFVANSNIYYAYDNAYTVYSEINYSTLCLIPEGYTIKCRIVNQSLGAKKIVINSNKQDPQPDVSPRTTMTVQRIL